MKTSKDTPTSQEGAKITKEGDILETANFRSPEDPDLIEQDHGVLVRFSPTP